MNHTSNMYQCKRCSYTSSRKSDFIQHLKRKIPCQVKPDGISVSVDDMLKDITRQDKVIPCTYCDKSFTSIQGRCQHLKHFCKVRQQEQCDIEQLKQQVSELTEKVSTMTTSITQTNNTTNNTNNTNNTMINNNTTINLPALRNFGEENMAAIPLQFIRDCYMNLNLKMLFEELHCTPEYPENHNVRLKSTKRELLEIYKDNKWKSMCYQDGFREVIEQMYRIFVDFSKENKDLICEDLNDDELLENEAKLDKIYNWIADTQQRIKTIKEVKQIAAVLDTNRD
jgi:hypothetical protein